MLRRIGVLLLLSATASADPDLLSLSKIDGPFPSVGAWCQKGRARCGGPPEQSGPAGGIFAVELESHQRCLVVGVRTDDGWYATLAPGCSGGILNEPIAVEERRAVGGPPVVLFRYRVEQITSNGLSSETQAEWALLCVAGTKPACARSAIPVTVRGTGSLGDAAFALHVDMSLGDVAYRAGKLAFYLHADKRLVAGGMSEAVEWRRRLSLLSGPHALSLP